MVDLEIIHCSATKLVSVGRRREHLCLCFDELPKKRANTPNFAARNAASLKQFQLGSLRASFFASTSIVCQKRVEFRDSNNVNDRRNRQQSPCQGLKQCRGRTGLNPRTDFNKTRRQQAQPQYVRWNVGRRTLVAKRNFRIDGTDSRVTLSKTPTM